MPAINKQVHRMQMYIYLYFYYMFAYSYEPFDFKVEMSIIELISAFSSCQLLSHGILWDFISHFCSSFWLREWHSAKPRHVNDNKHWFSIKKSYEIMCK